METDHEQQPHGIHIHHTATAISTDSASHPIITDIQSHIITVDKGTLKEDFQFTLPLLALILVLLIPAVSVIRYVHARTNPTPLLFYTHYAGPRAPPYA